VVAVDDRDDELRALVAQRRVRQRAVEAEGRAERACSPLVRATACGGKPGQQQQQP
jgi:hypothetical protein